MSTVTFVSKKPAGRLGNFNYEYACTCGGGAKKPNVTVTAANDNEAKMLAQMECDDSCGEGNPRAAISEITVSGPESIIRVDSVTATTLTVTADQVYESVQTVAPRSLACVSFFPSGFGSVGISNNCAECKLAVVMWSGVGVYQYRVPGNSYIIVNVVSSNGQLIQERPC
jgi:hypothetical protein